MDWLKEARTATYTVPGVKQYVFPFLIVVLRNEE
jgi:hypothetical protein